MFRDSRIGTPDCTSVPSVRIVRATVDFSTICPDDGDHQQESLSRMIRPGLVAVQQLDDDPEQDRRDQRQQVYHRCTTMSLALMRTTSSSWAGARPKSSKIFLNCGTM